MGRYEGQLTVHWLSDGRRMQLADSFSFVDGTDLRWDVPRGARIDGASIPAVLWSITGSPYTGKYRDASVVHDFYCSVRTRTSDATHRMFHEAMIVSGVSPKRAAIMYAAVRYAGPRWSDMDTHNTGLATDYRWSDHLSAGGGAGGVAASSHDRGVSPGSGGGFGGTAGINVIGAGDGPGLTFTTPAWAPENASRQEFARLAGEIMEGPLDLDVIAAKVDAAGSRLIELPSGVFDFEENPELLDENPEMLDEQPDLSDWDPRTVDGCGE